MKHKTWLLIAIAWNVFILVISFIPARAIPEFSWASALSLDKVVHLGVYFLLYVFFGIYSILKWGRSAYNKWAWWIILIYVALTGWYTEVVQSITYAGRHFDVLDLIANIIGTLGGCLILYLFHKKIMTWGLSRSQH